MINVIISEFCGLGNSVLLSSAFRSLKKSKKYKTYYVGNDKFSGLTIHDYNKFIDDIINISKLNSKNFFKFIKLIKSTDFVIIPEHSNPNLLFFFGLTLFFKGELIISSKFFKRLNIFKKIFLNFFFLLKKTKILKIDFPEDIHEIEINKRFIDPLLDQNKKESDNIFLNYFDHPGDINALNKFGLSDKKYFVLQPFCANGLNNYGKFSKSWPVRNFEDLSLSLLKYYNEYSIVYVGDKGDGGNIINYTPSNRIVNLISKTNISELITILKFSSFIVCHDSSILHLSDAMKLKNLSLFGPTKFHKNKPNNSISYYIKKFPMSNIFTHEVFEIIKKNI